MCETVDSTKYRDRRVSFVRFFLGRIYVAPVWPSSRRTFPATIVFVSRDLVMCREGLFSTIGAVV